LALASAVTAQHCTKHAWQDAQALIQAGADVNFTLWPDERIALPGACQYGYSIGIVKALLNTGANVNTQNK